MIEIATAFHKCRSARFRSMVIAIDITTASALAEFGKIFETGISCSICETIINAFACSTNKLLNNLILRKENIKIV